MTKELKILIIDDSATVRVSMKKLIEELEHIPILSNNGLIGLEDIVTYKPDLILLDLTMPILSGLEVLATLKLAQESRDIPIIILSGREEHSESLRAKQLGASGFIKKPCTLAELKELINLLLTPTLPTTPKTITIH